MFVFAIVCVTSCVCKWEVRLFDDLCSHFVYYVIYYGSLPYDIRYSQCVIFCHISDIVGLLDECLIFSCYLCVLL